MSNKKAVLFDLDGTVADSAEDLATAVNTALEKLNFPQRSLAEIKTFLGNGADVLIERALPEDKKEYKKEALELFRAKYKENMLLSTKPYEGITDVIKFLKENNIYTAIVSNKPHAAAVEISNKLFGSLIDFPLGAEPEKRPKKPSPLPLLYALENLGVKKENAVYVGDSDVDIETGKSAGIYTIAVTWGYRDENRLKNADAIVRTRQELKTLLEQLI